ncbi:hypothetical protein [Desulforamulus aeronauticus]|uniref:ATP-grasp domain-containing protein n=1 Tax=Desulforamulus aeronauticus DSM 10349 TaxID=1121421 RepID=A0A1M6T508_9FIRM|nr:hypothetical protein [Desulforamulus aeronauticus]SHK51959.1 hypothetical protein SAMN02745123_02174 [Desulforamulus aeronauticus DSM 10349]
MFDKDIKSKAIIIFSGYNQRAIIAFLRTLKNKKIENYAIIAKSRDDTILLTEYKEKVIYIRKKYELSLDEFTKIIKLVQRNLKVESCLIAPSTEALNRFLLENKQYFVKMNCIIPLAEKEIYEDISDKKKFGIICSQNKIRIPKEISLSNFFDRPFVAKPKTYFAQSNGKIHRPILVETKEIFVNFVNNYDTNDFYYQEFIDGKSYYLLYYFTRKGKIYKLSQENYMQQANGRSIIAAVTTNIHKKKISSDFEKLFLLFGYHGLVMVEVRLHNNNYYMIEANPRFWGPSQLFVDANYNFFEILLSEYGFLLEEPNLMEPQKMIRYFWGEGILNDLLNCNMLVHYGNHKKEIYRKMNSWIKIDVYGRNDTKKLFYTKETLMKKGERNG